MNRTTAPTEPCAGCRRPVVPNRWTERSRHSGRPWCDGCGRAPSANFLSDGESRFAVTRSYTEDRASGRKVQCDSCGQMRPAMTSVKAKAGTWECEVCRKSHLDPAMHQRSAVERELEDREAMGPELAAIREAALAQFASTGRIDPYLESRLEEWYGPVEPVVPWYAAGEDRDDDDDDTYETRSLEDDDVGPTLAPSGLWEVRTGAGNGFFADYDLAEERAAEVRAGLR